MKQYFKFSLLSIFLIMFLIIYININISSTSYASYVDYVTIDKNIQIKHNNVLKEFYDPYGNIVYPIVYNSTTYLPIRAVSSLFREPISWNDIYKLIMIGEGTVDYGSIRNIATFKPSNNEVVKATINTDLRIAYKDFLQSFKDATGNIVYPISYNDTTYLPIRAISNMFGSTITWDAQSNSINLIGYIERIFVASDDDESKSKKKKKNKNDDDEEDEFIDFFDYEFGIFTDIDSYSEIKRKSKRYYKVVLDYSEFDDDEIESLINQGHEIYVSISIDDVDTSSEEYAEYLTDLVDIGIAGFFVNGCDDYENNESQSNFDRMINSLTFLRDNYAEVIINDGSKLISKYFSDYPEKNKLKKVISGFCQQGVFTKIRSDNSFARTSSDVEDYYTELLNDIYNLNVDIYVVEHTTSSSLEDLIEDFCNDRSWYFYINDSIKFN